MCLFVSVCVCARTYLVCYIVFTFATINVNEEALFTSVHTHSHSHASIHPSIHLKQVNDKWVSIKENDSNFSSLFEFAGCQLTLIGIWHGLGCNGNYRSANVCEHTHTRAQEKRTIEKTTDSTKKVISTSSCLLYDQNVEYSRNLSLFSVFFRSLDLWNWTQFDIVRCYLLSIFKPYKLR